MDEGRKIQRRITLLLRARRAFLAFSATAFFILGALVLGKVLSFSLPSFCFLLLPFLAGLFFLWPLRVRWVRVGERLGVGGKLAALVAALKAPSLSFVSLLSSQISLRPWRLFFPEIFALLPALVLVGFFLVPWSGPELFSFPTAPATSSVLEEKVEALPAEPGPQGQRRSVAQEIPQLPPGFSYPRSLYEELLARLLGEKVSPEEVWERLAQEEGLFRRLAELLSEASVQGVTAETQAEFSELVSEIARPDLRSALWEKGEDLAEAKEIVAAALEGLAAIREELSLAGTPPSEEGATEGTGVAEREESPKEALAEGAREILMDIEVEEHLWARLGEAEEEGGPGLGAGWERGEPAHLGPGLSPAEVEEVVAVPLRPGEGPVRQGFILGLPGETPGEEPASSLAFSAEETEFLLSAKDLPPELRELVRRYFQHLAQGGGP
ncbi:hypothetical protein H5T56_02200 [Candidatus Bipolaricaulota bacterium]|nr:hypothetical protein [Candidatus Bipolaricaulota bacterium]